MEGTAAVGVVAVAVISKGKAGEGAAPLFPGSRVVTMLHGGVAGDEVVISGAIVAGDEVVISEAIVAGDEVVISEEIGVGADMAMAAAGLTSFQASRWFSGLLP